MTYPITITLTPKQAAKLSESLHDHCDEGSSLGGWASRELSELRALVDAAIEAATKVHPPAAAAG